MDIKWMSRILFSHVAPSVNVPCGTILFYRGPKLFNCLPKDLRDSEVSVDTFKNRLDQVLQKIPDKPSMPHYYQSASGNSIIEQLEAMNAQGIYLD